MRNFIGIFGVVKYDGMLSSAGDHAAPDSALDRSSPGSLLVTAAGRRRPGRSSAAEGVLALLPPDSVTHQGHALRLRQSDVGHHRHRRDLSPVRRGRGRRAGRGVLYRLCPRRTMPRPRPARSPSSCSQCLRALARRFGLSAARPGGAARRSGPILHGIRQRAARQPRHLADLHRSGPRRSGGRGMEPRRRSRTSEGSLERARRRPVAGQGRRGLPGAAELLRAASRRNLLLGELYGGYARSVMLRSAPCSGSRACWSTVSSWFSPFVEEAARCSAPTGSRCRRPRRASCPRSPPPSSDRRDAFTAETLAAAEHSSP